MMSSTDQAFERLRAANPVPDPTALLRRDEHTAGREATLRRLQMQTDRIDTSPTVTPGEAEPPRRTWKPLAVAAVIIAALIIGIPLLDGDESSTPDVVATTPEPESAVDVARSVMATTSEAELAALFAHDVSITSESLDITAVSGDEYLAWVRWANAIGSERTDVTCSGEGSVVECEYLQTSAIEQAYGAEPSRHRREFVVEDGLVATMTERVLSENEAEAESVWTDFYTWLDQVMGAEADQMVERPAFTPLVFEEDSIARWRDQTDAYVTYVEHERIVADVANVSGAVAPEAAGALIAPNAIVTGIESLDSATGWAEYARYHEAIGSERSDFDCEPIVSGGDVRCSFTYTNSVLRALDVDGPNIVTVEATIADGLVTEWRETVELTPDARQRGFSEFYEWMATDHPDQVESVIDIRSGWDIDLSPESLSLLSQWADEYITAMGG